VTSVSWSGGGPWLELASQLQRVLGPHYVGVPLTSYRDVADGMTESVFGDLTVEANWTDAVHDGIAPHGFRASAPGVVAGVFAGTHYLIFERDATGVTVRQPVGADTDVTVDLPAGNVTALAADGSPIAGVSATVQDGRLVFRWARTLGGRTVAAYRVST
jgi:hypothetical protein